MMLKVLMAPLMSLNQLQLKLKEMVVLLTSTVASATWVEGGSTGGPAK